MKLVGITGGIGSGKSLVCQIFKCLGVCVYDADLEAKRIISENQSVKTQIKKVFGNDIYISQNQINSKKLASIIFSDKSSLEIINSIVHPVLFQDFENWTKAFKNEKYLIIEAAILLESNYYKQLDKVISVLSPLDLRINRIQKRNHISKEDIIERIASQSLDQDKIKISDFIINNDYNNLLIPQVLKIHKDLSG